MVAFFSGNTWPCSCFGGEMRMLPLIATGKWPMMHSKPGFGSFIIDESWKNRSATISATKYRCLFNPLLEGIDGGSLVNLAKLLQGTKLL